METTDRVKQFQEWLREEEKAENTIHSYIKSVDIFFQNFKEITKKNMIDFKMMMLDQRSPKTAANRCIAMNQYCKFIGKPECTVKGIKIHKQNNVENVISIEEYERFIEQMKSEGKEKVYYLLKYLAQTGARVSEIRRFEKTCLDTGEVILWTKGKFRKILIPCELIEESREFFDKQESRWLFVNRSGEQLSTRGIAEIIKKNGKRCGIREEVLHPHSFRHLFAIQFLKNNKNIALLADLMGHESVDTTAIYLRLSAEEQRKQFDEAINW